MFRNFDPFEPVEYLTTNVLIPGSMMSAPFFTLPGPRTAPDNVFERIVLNGTDNLTVTANQSLYGTLFNLIRSNDSRVTIDNAGTIWNTRDPGNENDAVGTIVGLNLGTVTNSGLIVAETAVGNAFALGVSSRGDQIINSGGIYAIGDWLAEAVYTWEPDAVVINSGIIGAYAASTDPGAAGAYGVNQYNGERFINEVDGQVLAQGSYARGLGFFGGDLFGQPGDISILNRGLIEARSTNPAQDSVGIWVSFLDIEYMNFVNHGTLKADLAYLSLSFVSPAQHSPDLITNSATGQIIGRIETGLGNDVIINDGLIEGDVLLQAGGDRFEGAQGQLVGALFGGVGNDDLETGIGAQTIDGGAGRDFITGGQDADTLTGGADEDIFYYNAGDSTSSARDQITDFETGIDGIAVWDLDVANISINAITGGSRVIVSLVDGDSLEIDVTGTITVDDVKLVDGINRIQGGTGDDILIGTSLDEELSGFDGNDVLSGGAGNDILFGGTGSDSLYGGLGSDILYGNGGDDYLEDIDGGSDILRGDAGNDSFLVRRPEGNTDFIRVYGGPGNDFIHFQGFGVFDQTLALVDVGTGDNHVVVSQLLGIINVNLGSGDDVVELMGADTSTGEQFVIMTNFDLSPGGDLFRFNEFLAENAVGWNYLSNPFASGFARIRQLGSAVDIDFDFNRDGTYDFGVRFSGRNINNFDADSLDGFAPGGSNQGRTVYGTNGTDSLKGSGSHDQIFGFAGNDFIRGGTGHDNIEGGDGDDDIDGQYGNDIISGGDGNDVISDLLQGIISISGDSGDDIITIRRDSGAAGATGNVAGGTGSDQIKVSLANGQQLDIQAGADSDLVSLENVTGDLTITLGSGLDVIRLEAEFVLAAGTTVTVTDFEAGNNGDQISFDDFFAENLLNWSLGDNPIDTGHIELLQIGADLHVRVDVDGGADELSTLLILENVQLSSLNASNLGFDPIDRNLYGTINSDVLAGTDENNFIYGLAGDDNISGLAGDDLLEGGSGNDILDGGTGVDAASYGDAPSLVRVNLAIQGAVQNTLGGGLDTLISIENAIGSAFNDRLFGNDEINRINGGAGNDLIFGRRGNDALLGGSGDDIIVGGLHADAMSGGSGNDIFYVDHGGDTVSELAGEGTDEVRSIVSFTLGNNIENLQIQLNAINGTGNDLDNVIIANGQQNVLRGLGGNDNLQGGSNTDTLHGGSGNDFLYGGQGNDILNGDAGDDVLNGQNNSDTLNGGDGDDVLRGEDGQDILNGGAGNDSLQGGALIDQLNGGDGIDALFGGDGNDLLNGGAGVDRLYGGAGRDIMTGGNDKDYFTFADGDFAGLTVTNSDRITDFSQVHGDLIRLDQVDAITGGGDDAFTFIGIGAFGGTAGELRYEAFGGATLITGDTDGDGNADFAIRLDGLHILVEADFLL